MSLDNNGSRKRKADVLARLSQSSAASSGRGATAGWTLCPFCGDSQKKKFAAGRGIAAHLHAVHTPWKPPTGKAAKRKKRRIEQRRLAEACRSTKKNDDDLSTDETTMPTTSQPSNSATASDDDAGWTPTEKEVDEWNETVLKIITQLELETESSDEKNSQNIKSAATKLGLDRNGSTAQDYRNSLPEFLQAAANGDLLSLERMCDEASARAGNDSLRALLYTRDRHGSTAEHWAAGSGQLKCLQWIIAKQLEHPIMPAETPAKVRRRDGKSALHYAARNGHLHCIHFLVESCAYQVNAASGDGTTPFHLACFGAHLTVAQYLIQQGSNAVACNEWKCSAVHWVAMTKNDSTDKVICFCEYLKTELGLSFAAIQKQGHSALHKAAQRLNRPIIEWLLGPLDEGGAGLSQSELRTASQADDGGHFPWDIWRSVGGDEGFGVYFETHLKSITTNENEPSNLKSDCEKNRECCGLVNTHHEKRTEVTS